MCKVRVNNMQMNLYAEELQLQRLSHLGDALEKLKIINFEKFRSVLSLIQEKLNKQQPLHQLQQ